jgi:polyhydroxyalkanoate synthesis regulator phasin
VVTVRFTNKDHLSGAGIANGMMNEFPCATFVDCDGNKHFSVLMEKVGDEKMNMEKAIRIIDELISEAQKEPKWKTENALRCLKKELLKEQEMVEPFHKCIGKYHTLIEDSGFVYCPYCGKSIMYTEDR